ncbi:GHKL domain-containing protein [[Clostridium] polysaccharolyticum]|nr:GHKL domain-containing protein [[Clostridium] polysaccharolyticum]
MDNIIIPLQDLNAIITNMLDNAIEACEKIGNRKKEMDKV